PVIVSGGWTWEEWQGNATAQHPVDFAYYGTEKKAGNARGLPNSGREGLRQLGPMIRRLKEQGIKTGIQITNLPFERPADVIPQLAELAAEQEPAFVEVNLSCPNGKRPDGGLEPALSENAEACGEVMGLAYEKIGGAVLLGAKDSPHVASPRGMIDHQKVFDVVGAVKPYIDFLTGTNTIGNQDFSELTCADGKGGMSGPAIAPVARDWLMVAREALSPDIPILSCGGIDSENVAKETRERQILGALLVGGAQEFYRKRPVQVALQWAERWLLSDNS
ncbi:MAG TPA: hypothetical protein VFH39_01470, partial [Candidatus Saccharimonadales bacterium]|nr:hypothetical protein [Candidatus Saccharimonadales bacterium]